MSGGAGDLRAATRGAAIEDDQIYTAAADLLRELGDLPELDAAFDNDPLEALQVVVALRDSGRIDAVSALVEHDSSAVRSLAAHALGLLGGGQQALTSLLADPASLVRVAAVRSLGRLKSFEILRKRAQTESDPLVRVALVDVLEPIGMWP